MTYQIYYLPINSAKGSRGYTMFDIEYYMAQGGNPTMRFSEISCLPCVEGIVYFLKYKLQDKINFDVEEFIKDATEIQEVRRTLYEKFDNRIKEGEEAFNFHYKVFGETLKEMLNKFANKYGLYINKD